MTRGPLARWRRAAAVAQAAVMLGLPFLRVGGESALRFDVPTLRLHAFGAAVWMDEFFVVLAGTLALAAAFLLVTLLFGRLWCGWACPQTALVDLTGWLERARRRGGWRLGLAYAGCAAVALGVAADLTWFFVTPGEFLRRLLSASLGPALGGTWLALAALLFADLALWRQGFCATTCPYARLQGALLDRHSLAIAYDGRRAGDCVDCGACVRACPVGLDIRDGLQAACTGCAACLDACAPVMRRLRRPAKLVGYFFGDPAREGGRPRWLRPGAVALALLAAAAAGLTVAAARGRAPLDLTVSIDRGFAPRRGPGGEAVVALEVAVENRGRAPLALALALRADGIQATLRPDRVALAPGEHRRLRVVATARGLAPGRPVRAELAAVAPAPGPGARADLTLALPEHR